MRELKPCPFCGGEARISHNMTGSDSWVICSSCYVYCPADRSREFTEAEAIEAWNTRAVEVCEIVGFADAEPLPIIPERTCHEVIVDKHWRGCSECSYKWEFMYGIAKCERPNYCPKCGAKVVE